MTTPFNALALRDYSQHLPTYLPRRGRWITNWFSNFQTLSPNNPVYLGSLRYSSIENAYQAAKSLDPAIRAKLAGIAPFEAKRLDRTLQIRPDWENVCLAAMWTFLVQAWTPTHRDFRSLLHAPRPLVEWNNWGDSRWGCVVTPQNQARPGRNALARLLMYLADRHLAGDIPTPPAEADWPEVQSQLIQILNTRY